MLNPNVTMGAQQSSSNTDSAGVPPAKVCYYELLGIDRDANDDDIKKAYRRKALELHPDRNLHDVETATRRFAEVQAAHEVLSDPQERAWYDSHRDAILSGSDTVGDGAEPTTFRNVRLTSTEDIMKLIRMFNATVPFNDEPMGFYGIARETFEHLALEEEAAAEFADIDSPDLPTFGSFEDDYDSVVKPFYSGWSGFSTLKSFSWKDKYRLSDAPDRRVRRLMEKENKKNRDDAIREFNDAVRFLVTFVRKRDPRYIPNTQSEADRQQSLRDAAAKQAARSRAANQERLATFQAPEWVGQTDATEGDFSDVSDELGDEVEILECVVCNKTFKSDKQLQAHERSKKHLKAVQQLRRHLRKEGLELEIDTQDGEPTADAAESPGRGNPARHQEPTPSDTSDNGKSVTGPDEEINSNALDSASAVSMSDEEYAPRTTVEERFAHSLQIDPNDTAIGTFHDHPAPTAADTADMAPTAKKVGKAKMKKEKKAAALRQEADIHRCTTCLATFESKTKLFHHIRTEGHAALAKAVPANKKNRR